MKIKHLTGPCTIIGEKQKTVRNESSLYSTAQFITLYKH